VQFSRIRFLDCTRFRAGYNPVCSGPQGGWLILLRSDVSGMRCLAGLRASVESFPMSWAFPTVEYSARYDSPRAYGGRSRCQYFSACLAPWSTASPRFQHCSVSGFPLSCLRSCLPYAVASHGEERLGPPTFFDISLPACHGLRTPADLHHLAKSGALVLPSGAFKPSASALAISKLYQHFRVRGHPYGLQDALSTLRPSCSPFYLPTPPWTQDSIRVGGYPLPGRDFHPARDAKLFLAR
jgi:hypothetical protein